MNMHHTASRRCPDRSVIPTPSQVGPTPSRRRNRVGPRVLLPALVVAGSLIQPALATPLTVRGLFHMRSFLGANSVGIATGDRQFFGAVNVNPPASLGTTGSASFRGGPTLALRASPTLSMPNRFSRTPAFNPGRTGRWRLRFANGGDTIGPVMTPSIDGVAALPLAQAISISDSGGAGPSIGWTVPTAASGVDFVSLVIYDLENFIPLGGGRSRADIVEQSGVLPASTRAYRIGSGAFSKGPLLVGHRYSAAVVLSDTRAGRPARFIDVQSRSWSFADFTLAAAGAPSIPEPGTIGLLGLGALLLTWSRKQRRQH